MPKNSDQEYVSIFLTFESLKHLCDIAMLVL